MEHKNWMGFAGESWKEHIDVRSFIQDNYTIYTGDESFSLQPDRKNTKIISPI